MSPEGHLKEGLRKLRAANGERYDSAIIVWEEASAITAEVIRMREANDKLRGALKPFADEVRSLQPWQGCDGHDGDIRDCPLWKFTRVWHGDTGPTVTDCLLAAALLKEST